MLKEATKKKIISHLAIKKRQNEMCLEETKRILILPADVFFLLFINKVHSRRKGKSDLRFVLNKSFRYIFFNRFVLFILHIFFERYDFQEEEIRGKHVRSHFFVLFY